MAADDVPQVYLQFPAAEAEPLLLRGFQRVRALQPGASVLVKMSLLPNDLSVFDANLMAFRVSTGTFVVLVCRCMSDPQCLSAKFVN
jgi:hypothetical protein